MARFPSALPLGVNDIARMMGWANDTIEPRARGLATSSVSTLNGIAYFTFFRPAVNMTVTQISSASISLSSGATLARMGIYKINEDNSATLLARTANDLTLFTSSNTVYTRNFDTAGGYPSSITLIAGNLYAISQINVGSNLGSRVGYTAVNTVLSATSPLTGGSISSQSDLPASTSSIALSGASLWGRLS